MNKLGLLTVMFVLFAGAAALRGDQPAGGAEAATVATGEAAPELAGAWTGGDPVKLADQRGKNLTVLYFWTVSRNTVAELPRFKEIVERYSSRPVVFVGVGCDEFRKVGSFTKAWGVPIPVLADDKLETLRRYLRKTDRVPLAVIVDREGRLAWRGRAAALPRTLDEMLNGKFDLAEHIRREKFSGEVSSALAKGHCEDAVKLLDGELKRDPANVELIAMKSAILARELKQPDDALKTIDAAIAAAPDKVALYDLKLQVLHHAKLEDRVPELYDRICAKFADRPAVLLRYGEIEMNRPLKDTRPELICKLMTAAANAPKFKDDRERGIVTIAYARMLHLCGQPVMAFAASKKALMLLKGTPEYAEAQELSAFFARCARVQNELHK